MRPSGRKHNELRSVLLEPHVSRHAEGSCLVQFGNTRLICAASIDAGVPPFLRNTGKGWVTAEYGMLPRSTNTRMPREAAKGKVTGRTQEIQRLIGRSLRAVMDLHALGERQITVDCDVIEADGGTRTAAITGGYVALHLACQRLLSQGKIDVLPIRDSVAAVSCGMFRGTPVLDLDYDEDSNAEVDANFIFTGAGRIVEIQGTAEQEPFSEEDFTALMGLAKQGTQTLVELQRAAIHASK